MPIFTKLKNRLKKRALLKRQMMFFKQISNPKDVSIISSNCWGAELYHDAKKRFLSPTINLTFDPMDFLKFVSRIDEIKSTKIIEIKDHKLTYPVGKLVYPDGDAIVIRFVHYNSFEEARIKFYDRASRIINNIVVLFMVRELTDELLCAFNKLKLKKVCVYGRNISSNKLLLDKIYVKFEKIITSKKDVLSFKSYLSAKRIIDDVDFDYYSFCFIE